MKETTRILHIDPSYQVVYFILRERTVIKSTVPLKTAIRLLQNSGEFDLIISEPQEMALLNRQARGRTPAKHENSDRIYGIERILGPFPDGREKPSAPGTVG